MAGFVRQTSNYNPLSQDQKLASLDDVWIVVADGATFRKAASFTAELAEETLEIAPDTPGIVTSSVPKDAQLYGKIEGDWIRLVNTGNYAPVKDPSGKRFLKNKKVILAEQGPDDMPKRIFSNDSVRSGGSKGKLGVLKEKVEDTYGCKLM
eukprot:TRINITY_DN631_c2_g2_i1.p1 TRINITY_DN631_c2_g2~~TRINITY_DN631_c2_g2_i1.p1  ORF type:complete len:151 (+),score=38.80 TRINITY_DN631_c2_g2_i1:98-550(+)